MVQVGDSIPSVALTEKEPGNTVDLATEVGNGKALIVGVPAAFSKFFVFVFTLYIYFLRGGWRG